MTKPFLKWAGGKANSATKIAELLPEKFNYYFEPFLGAGSVYLYLQEFGLIRLAKLSDQCAELINCWELLSMSGGAQDIFDEVAKLNQNEWTRERYNDLRSWDRNAATHRWPDEKAARFILLNKLGFNGLCRYNSRGEFNVPWGKRVKCTTPTLQHLLAIYEALPSAHNINCCDYKTALAFVDKGDFAYLDPPYVPLSKSGFTTYSGAWGEKQQRELFAELQRLDSLGVKWMLSGHDEPFYRQLYDQNSFGKLSILSLEAARSIAANGNREKVKELIIRNYI
jgi:DNA adenine methylase